MSAALPSASHRPRVLFVGATRYVFPLAAGLERKFDALGRQMEFRVLARGTSADGRFRLITEGPSFYARLPLVLRRECRVFGPDAVVAEDPRLAALALWSLGPRGRRPRVIAEVHGDWRHATRLYGSAARRLWSPAADAVARYGLRHADAVRTLAGYLSSTVRRIGGRVPDAEFPTYGDLTAFAGSPVSLPVTPSAIFIGSLEPVKNIESLARAWRTVCARTRAAHLTIVGTGSQQRVVDRLAADLPDRVTYHPRLDAPAVARAIDASTILVLPSRFEGLGRVIIEAFARRRGVVATRAGGVLDLVEDGRQGLLVDVDDDAMLADTLVRVLTDRDLAARLGDAAYATFPKWNQSADRWAERMRELVDLTLSRR